ncbi:E3 ubiquitin-protein ligase rnf4 [Quaeritorhiza haematococci]|nr:E3 ubiquitin-protein ligase rnf4 [Quaeritorhiza haematococci]
MLSASSCCSSGGPPGGKQDNGGSVDEKNAPEVIHAFAEELTCPICLDLIDDGRCTPCLHTFCRECITSALKKFGVCPICDKKIGPNDLVGSSRVLMNVVDIVRQLHGLPPSTRTVVKNIPVNAVGPENTHYNRVQLPLRDSVFLDIEQRIRDRIHAARNQPRHTAVPPRHVIDLTKDEPDAQNARASGSSSRDYSILQRIRPSESAGSSSGAHVLQRKRPSESNIDGGPPKHPRLPPSVKEARAALVNSGRRSNINPTQSAGSNRLTISPRSVNGDARPHTARFVLDIDRKRTADTASLPYEVLLRSAMEGNDPSGSQTGLSFAFAPANPHFGSSSNPTITNPAASSSSSASNAPQTNTMEDPQVEARKRNAFAFGDISLNPDADALKSVYIEFFTKFRIWGRDYLETNEARRIALPLGIPLRSFVCPLSKMTVSPGEGIELPCKHAFHATTLKRRLKCNLTEGDGVALCPETDCKAWVPRRQVAVLLGSRWVDRYETNVKVLHGNNTDALIGALGTVPTKPTEDRSQQFLVASLQKHVEKGADVGSSSASRSSRKARKVRFSTRTAVIPSSSSSSKGKGKAPAHLPTAPEEDEAEAERAEGQGSGSGSGSSSEQHASPPQQHQHRYLLRKYDSKSTPSV